MHLTPLAGRKLLQAAPSFEGCHHPGSQGEPVGEKRGKETNVSTEESKATIRRWFEDLFDEGNLDVADEIVAPNHVAHGPALRARNTLSASTAALFPTPISLSSIRVAEGNEVVTR